MDELIEVKTKNGSYKYHKSSYIDENPDIGDGTTIWHFCHILSNAKIGSKCTLGQNVSIASRSIVGNNVKIQNNVSVYDGVVIEDDVFCGPSIVFTNISTPRSFVKRRMEFKETRIKKGSSIGANATIVCGVTVGEYSLIGAGAVVAKDVPAYALMVGVPAKQIGWVCYCGATLDEELKCNCCKKKYKLNKNKKLSEII
jgi:UDP-2-acetamido-3-amino-2,3-dideoxy-glucuronate N-acetyltransferase